MKVERPLLKFCLALAAVLCLVGAAPAQPKRVMPFLGRDAVVRESAEKTPLAGKGLVPRLVVAAAPEGPAKAREDGWLAQAGKVFADRVEKIAGVAPGAEAPGAGRVFIGAQGDPTALFPDLKTADAHGFVIARKGDDLHIVGASPLATLYGVWFFLYNYAGLRVLMPGELGEVYEKVETLAIPGELYVFNPGPDFRLRIWTQAGFDRLSWLQDASGTERFQYHHPWARMLPSDKFGKTRPELYPILGGKRFIPPAGGKAGMWQPTFSEPKLVDHVMEFADEEFTRNPGLMSISVTVNDGAGYSELDMTDGIEGWRIHYFNFVNAVARRLAKKWPGKFAAFLSYGEASKPPPFKLEDNVMLFVFSYQGNPEETVKTWGDKVKRYGVYQWLYGAGWALPNQWPHGIQDYLRYIRSIGGVAFKGEAAIPWAQDGARLWVMANLLWNVDADAGALLDDYLVHAYGKEAAPAMRRYFDQAEKLYERRRNGLAFNLTRHRCGVYQFQSVTEDDFRVMGAALAEAGQAARGEANRTRVDWTTRCFEFGRLYWSAYQAQKAFEALAAKESKAAADWEAMLDQAGAFSKAVWAIPVFQKEKIATAPKGVCESGLGHEYWLGVGFRWRQQHNVFADGLTQMTRAMLQSGAPEQALERWRRIGEQRPELRGFSAHQQWALLPKDARLRNLLSNGSFEDAAPENDAQQTALLERFRKWDIKYADFNDQKFPGLAARDWVVFNRNSFSMAVERDATTAKDGRHGLRVSGAGYYGGVLRHFEPPDPRGRYRLSFWYKTNPDCGLALCGVAFYKGWGFEFFTKALEPSAEWKQAEIEFTFNDPPEDAAATLALFTQQSKPAGAAWFDDVRVEWLAPEGATPHPPAEAR